MNWLERLPFRIVRACAAMMPRLQAEESLTAVERTAVGTGSLKKEDAQAITRAWARDVAPSSRERVQRITPEALEAIGIQYQIVPPAP